MKTLSILISISMLALSSTSALAAEQACPTPFSKDITKIDKRIKYVSSMLANAKAYEKETAALAQESKTVANVSSIVASISATLLFRSAGSLATDASIQLIGANALLAETKQLMFVKDLLRSAQMASVGFLADSAMNPSNTNSPSEAKGVAKARELSGDLFSQFEDGHKVVQAARDKIDMNYSNLWNGLTLGRKGNKAMNALHDTVVADRKLYEIELNYLKSLKEASLESCSSVRVATNQLKKVRSPAVEFSLYPEIQTHAGSIR